MSAIDKKMFEERIREYMPNMYRLALGILHNREDAEDAVSESVLKAYEKLDMLRRKDSFKAWLMQITANEAKRMYTKKKREITFENMEEYMPVFEDEHHELWDSVMKMQLAYREVILLFYYEQLSIKEIAHILKIPEGTVKSRLSRAKKILKENIV